jgi:nucleoside-diphosphate-sugar epimerase
MSKLHLVTGGAGYFGTILVQRLVHQGHRVRIFDINEADEKPAGVETVKADIRDRDAVLRACEGVAVVHHNVALVPLAKDVEAFWSVNEGGTRNLLEAALARKVGKVVHMSSSAVFGVPPRNPVDDSVEPNPQEDYGRAKLAGEKLCHDHVARGLDVTIIRPRTIMGHGRLGIMQILFEWIREGKPVPVFGKGANRYQFVHADDLASAAIKAGERPGAGTYNVGADRFGTMRETLAALIAHAGTGSRIVSVPAGPAVAMMNVTSRLGLSPLGAYHSLMYGREMYFDLERTRRELDWAPRFSNAEMFCESYDWYLRNRDEVLGRHHASHHRSPVKQGVLRAVSVGLKVFPSAHA